MSKLCVLPLIYVVAWFYFLITWLIPILNVPFSQYGSHFASFSLWTIISIVLFLVPGIILLIIAVVLFFMILTD
jgi:hypothetical protein